MRQKRKSYREPEDDEDGIGEDLAAVNDRLDALTRQLEIMAQANVPPRAAVGGTDERSDRVSEALARLDRRLDQVISEGRATASEHRARYTPPPPPPIPMAMPAPMAAPAYAPPMAMAMPMMAPPAYAPPPRIAAAPPSPPPPAAPSRGPANWATQIAARQRMLDGGPAAVPPAPEPAHQPAQVHPAQVHPAQVHQPAPIAAVAPPQWNGGHDLSGLQHQLHHLNTQISALHQNQPYEHVLTALRGDLSEIGRALTEAMPRRAIETLENEIRALSERVAGTRQAGADGAALGALERELAEVRQALRGLTPAENLGGFEDAVRGLYQKIDQLAAAGQSAQGDPMAFKQLEQAVVSLRGVVSNVASDGALEQLAAEVRGLGAQFERATQDSSNEALGRLESRIATLMESGRAVPPELEGSIRELSERFDRMQMSQGDHMALSALEDRIAKLSAKLDASDSRLGHLEAIERGLADLLVYLEDMRSNNPRGLRAAPYEPAPVAPPPVAPEAVAPMPAPAPMMAPSPLDAIPDLLPPAPAMAAPVPMQPPAPQQLQPLAPRSAPVQVEPLPPESVRAMPPKTMPRGPQRQPIDPNLPPDTPLEPGSGAPRMKPGSAAARIAASEAALGSARPLAAETGGKAAAIAAARNAVKAAYLDTPVKVPKSLSPKSPKWLKWPFKRAAKELPPEPPVQTLPQAPTLPPVPTSMPSSIHTAMPPLLSMTEEKEATPSGARSVMKILKTLLIAASVAIIVVGVAQTAMEFLFSDTPSAPASLPAKDQSQSPPESQPSQQPPATTPSRPMPAPQGALPAPAGGDPVTTNSIDRGSSFFDPATAIKLPEVTGSISRKPVSPKPPGATPAGEIALPASISPALRTAVNSNDPAALYELGARYAEGRGVALNMTEAAAWLQRAADAGFAPAQFRLASLNEKGEGVRKDVQAARRLYLTAAAKGHAKAMHNLAVLYAEGIDGKPDYKAASEWFRKAAAYGVTDSQYNLAILYARGIGVSVNLAESYRWFSLAAASGDGDAAKKRDEVAARLDPKTLASAKLAAQGFVPEHEPDEAINLKAPPGGWDHVPPAPAKPRRAS